MPAHHVFVAVVRHADKLAICAQRPDDAVRLRCVHERRERHGPEVAGKLGHRRRLVPVGLEHESELPHRAPAALDIKQLVVNRCRLDRRRTPARGSSGFDRTGRDALLCACGQCVFFGPRTDQHTARVGRQPHDARHLARVQPQRQSVVVQHFALTVRLLELLVRSGDGTADQVGRFNRAAEPQAVLKEIAHHWPPCRVRPVPQAPLRRALQVKQRLAF